MITDEMAKSGQERLTDYIEALVAAKIDLRVAMLYMVNAYEMVLDATPKQTLAIMDLTEAWAREHEDWADCKIALHEAEQRNCKRRLGGLLGLGPREDEP